MKRKYVTLQLLITCLSKPGVEKKDIHTELAETIAERRRIGRQLRNRFHTGEDTARIPQGKKAA